MWTIAAVNKKFNGPLGSYNGLTDVHLAHYFSRPSRRSHLKAAKLITEDGFIIPEKNVKGELYIDEKKKRVYDILARSILQNAVHKEGSWNKKLCNYLEDISKMTAVDKARNTFKKKSSKVASEIFENHVSSNHSSEDGDIRSSAKWPNIHKKRHNPSYSAPVACVSLRKDGHHKVANLKRCLSAKEHSPYIVPLLLSGSYRDYNHFPLDFENMKQKKRKRKKCFTLTGNFKTSEKKILPSNKDANMKVSVPQSLKFSQCKITLLYHGHLKLSNFLLTLTENIIIKQQHCGGTPVVIYKGKIALNEMLSFLCLDHEGFFFSITVFLNGIRELKLSSCCVFRYLPGRRLGGTNGTFSIKRIEGGKPCLKCQYQELENGNFKSLLQMPEINVEHSIDKEDSVVLLDNDKHKTPDKSSGDESEVEEIAPEKIDEINTHNDQLRKGADDDIEEILSDIHNSDEKEDSVIEDHIVDESNASSVEDGIKENEISDRSDSPENVSEVSDAFVEPKKYEIAIDSSSTEDEGENQHVITVSVHGSPANK